MKLELSRHIFEKCSKIKFHENPSSGSRVVPWGPASMNAPKQMVRTVNILFCNYKQFTLRRGHCPAVNINQTIIPHTEAVKYPGLRFDCRLNGKNTAKKRKQIYLKTKEINWLIGKKSHLSIQNKLLIYNAVIKPMCSYGIELWGCASKFKHSHHAAIPIHNSQSQSKCTPLRNKSYSTYRLQHPLRKWRHPRENNKHHNKLEAQPNPLLEPLL